jgi:5-methylcytosine-specific restriction endonuclease McrA
LVKPPEKFHRDKRKRDGLMSACKECLCEDKRRRYRENPEMRQRRAEYAKRRYKTKRMNRPVTTRVYEVLESNKEKREYDRRWRQLNAERYRALKQRRRARQANAEGYFTPDEWAGLCERYEHKCVCCGKRKSLTVDHVVPISRGGTNFIENIQPLCVSCNSTKHANIIDYRLARDLIDNCAPEELFHLARFLDTAYRRHIGEAMAS